MEQKIQEYIMKIAKKEGIDINEASDLFETGVLDSLRIIMLLTFLQDEFSIDFEMEDLDYKNFQSLQSIYEWTKKVKKVKK